MEVYGVKVADGDAVDLDRQGLVVILEGLPVYVQVRFIIFGLEVEDGGDVGGFKSVNVFWGSGEGADIEIFEDLGVVHAVSLVGGLGQWSFEIVADCQAVADHLEEKEAGWVEFLV